MSGYFYEHSDAMAAFDNRISYVLNHQHKTLGQAWKDLPEYIFAFEVRFSSEIIMALLTSFAGPKRGNDWQVSTQIRLPCRDADSYRRGEAYVKAHQDWHCGRAKAIKANLPSGSPILSTTGGASWASESWMTNLLECEELDIIALHAYGAGEFTVDNLKQYVEQGAAKNKMVVMQECQCSCAVREGELADAHIQGASATTTAVISATLAAWLTPAHVQRTSKTGLTTLPQRA